MAICVVGPHLNYHGTLPLERAAPRQKSDPTCVQKNDSSADSLATARQRRSDIVRPRETQVRIPGRGPDPTATLGGRVCDELANDIELLEVMGCQDSASPSIRASIPVPRPARLGIEGPLRDTGRHGGVAMAVRGSHYVV